jgi:hypothetical protein
MSSTPAETDDATACLLSNGTVSLCQPVAVQCHMLLVLRYGDKNTGLEGQHSQVTLSWVVADALHPLYGFNSSAERSRSARSSSGSITLHDKHVKAAWSTSIRLNISTTSHPLPATSTLLSGKKLSMSCGMLGSPYC